ncbi:MAG: MMPL family transporter [Pseudomonadota bacterium]
MATDIRANLEPEDGKLRPRLAQLLLAIRWPLIALFTGLTLLFGWQMSKLKADASFEKMIPVSHPFIINFLENRDDLKGLGNSVRIIVETKEGDIFTPEFQALLREITDEVFYIRGVDRSGLQSLWTPTVRWSEVTEEGFVGGAVVPDDYDGTQRSVDNLRENTLKSGQVGRLVANNFKSAIILAQLTETDPETGERLDYHAFSQDLEELVRDKYQSDTIQIHITGFAKLVGDLIDGASLVAVFFMIALLITAVLLFFYCRCWRLTLIGLLCSVVAVVWQLGLLRTLGMGLDPYSMLVPFLVFAVGISHASQIINRFGLYAAQGAPKEEAAQLTFIKISKPGFIALVSDGVGFFTLSVIDIPVIQELAVVASTGIAVLIATNLILLPLILSMTGISRMGATHRRAKDTRPQPLWRFISAVTKRGPAVSILLVSVALFALGVWGGQFQKIGDLDAGAPELRADSRYNLDNAFLTDNYATSTDVLVVMAQTEEQQCGSYDFIDALNYFQGYMAGVPGVQSSTSLADVSKLVIQGMNEGNPKWYDISRNQYILNNSLSRAPSGLRNTNCSMAPVIFFLDDHKADTLTSVVNAVEQFGADHSSDAVEFQLAAGNAGIEAATNIVIEQAQFEMLLWVYGVVILLCLINFRSLRVTLCIILPLMLTSALGSALMAALGIGVKVATLPVIALGVGIGVDYGIYIYTALESNRRAGDTLRQAYLLALMSSGSAVAFTGVTLAIGVGTWIFSPIKFQADMGLMLTFMFFWNMVGALVLLPALAWVFYDRSHGDAALRETGAATPAPA